MKQKFKLAFYSILLISIAGCVSQTPSLPVGYALTGNERQICDSIQFDTVIIQEIRNYNSDKMEPFHYSLSKMIENEKETEIDPIHLKGLVFTEENAKAYDLVFALKDNFRKKGYSIFLLENNFGINDQSDRIGVLKTTDQFTVLKQVGTNGINYDITNDSLITMMKQFDKKYSFELVGASGDWCEFVIRNEPANWLDFAKEIYKACPDVVDQGTGTVEALAEEMKKGKRVYFWWD